MSSRRIGAPRLCDAMLNLKIDHVLLESPFLFIIAGRICLGGSGFSTSQHHPDHAGYDPC
jgi:hypothetical protein